MTRSWHFSQKLLGLALSGFFLAALGGEAASWPEDPVYSGNLCTINWIEILTTGTGVNLADDEVKGPFPIGFSFPFYGQTFTEFSISSNGFMFFGSGDTFHNNHCPLPNENSPENIIALLWDDLDPSQATGPAVIYESFTSCPNGSGACLVVEWNNYCHYPHGPTCHKIGTFEAILYEDGTIIMQFLDAGDEAGETSTTGIEGADAASDHGMAYACDTPNSLSDNLCLMFVPKLSPALVFSYGVCGIAHGSGAAGTEWRSSLAVSNPWGNKADLTLFYYVDGALNTSKPHSLAAGAIVEWADVLPDLFGITQSSKGAVFVEASQPIVMSARTFNQGPDGTYGQYLPGLEEWNTLWSGARGVLTQLKGNSQFRTNIGFFNLGGTTCTVKLQLYDNTGSALGGLIEQPIGPLVWLQRDKVFQGLGSHNSAYATVEVTGKDCEIWAYASVIDIKTGDPTTIPVLFEPGG